MMDKNRMPGQHRSGIRRVFTLNIGTIVFGILFIYLLISVIIYASRTHVDSYQVVSGPLASNSDYTGIAVYSESLVAAGTSGYIDYYASDCAKIRSGGVVYGISPDKSEQTVTAPDESTLNEISDDVQEYLQTFSGGNFHDVYSLKYLVEGALLSGNLEDAETDGSSSGNYTVGSETVCTSPSDGIISYATDNYFGVSQNDAGAELFDEKSYQFRSLRTSDMVEAGDPVYRIIDSESWSLLIPMTAKQIVRVSNTDTMRVKFLKDGITQNANFTILSADDGTWYGKLDFTGGLIRYLDSRFIDIELVTNQAVGLKIPVTAIVTKTFFTIPEEYASTGDDGRTVGFRKLVSRKDGDTTSEFVSTTLYEHADGVYYVDDTSFGSGDIIVRDGAESDRYIVRDTAPLEGVYCINKGYTVFRRIQVIDKNEDYCIVEKGTSYGISEYDNIVRDASSVKESQITAG